MKKIKTNWHKAENYIRRGTDHMDAERIGQAMSMFNKAIATAPRYAEAFISRGHCHCLGESPNRFDLAIADFTRALEIKPGLTPALLSRGGAYRETGQLDLAFKDATAVLRITPDSSFANDLHGMCLHEKGEFDGAIDAFTLAIENDPMYTWSICNRAKAYAANEQYKKALDDFSTALKQDPNYGPALKGFTELCCTTGEFTIAIEHYNKMIEANPDDGFPLMLRAEIYGLQCDFESAMRDIDAAIEMLTDPDDLSEAHISRATFHNEIGDDDQALADFDRAIDASPKRADLYVSRGKHLLELGQSLDDAINDFNLAIMLEPNGAMAYINRGRAHSLMGNPLRALPDYDKGIELLPKNADLYIDRAMLRMATGDQTDLAIADCSKAIEFASDPFDAYLARIEIYIQAEKYQEANSDCDSVIELWPESPEIHVLRGKVLSLRGETDRALADYSTAIGLDPYLFEAFVGRASLLKAKGEDEKALEDYARAAELMSSESGPEELLDAMFPLGPPADEAPLDEDVDRGYPVDVKQAIEELLDSLDDVEMDDLADGDKLPATRLKSAALVLKAVSLLDSGEYEEAISAVSEAIELRPECAQNMILRGIIYLAGHKDRDKAIPDFNKAIELDPDTSTPHFALGLAHYEDGRPTESTQFLSRAIELDPEYALAYILRGQAHRDIEEYDKALSDLHRGFELKAESESNRKGATQ